MFEDEKDLNEQLNSEVSNDDFVQEAVDETVSEAEDEAANEATNETVNKTDNQSTYYNQTQNDNQWNTHNNGNYYDYYSANQGNSNNPKKNNKSVVLVASIAVAAAVLIGGVALITDNVLKNAEKEFDNVGENAVEKNEKVEYPTIGSTVSDNDTDSDSSSASLGGVVITDVSDVVSNVMPSIVSITSTTIVESNNYESLWPFYGGYGESDQGYEEQVGAGSGIVVKQTDTELLIVTNNHVIAGADSLSIQFVNGTSIEGVTKSTDEAADIAIVSIKLSEIDSDTMSAIKIATLGSSDDTMVGEGVVAIGNALGYGQSVTTGVISAKEREINVDNQTMVVLQTDAAINGGNSGGALLNAKGEVIGINVAKYSSSSYSGSASVEGMGFAIPISQATDIINNLMNRETREKVDEENKGVLGIVGVAVDSSATEIYSLPQGVYIREVVEGGAAEKSGLRATDVITAFDGQSISSMESLQEKLEYYSAGEKVEVTVMRNTDGGYREMTVELTLSPAKVLDEAQTE